MYYNVICRYGKNNIKPATEQFVGLIRILLRNFLTLLHTNIVYLEIRYQQKNILINNNKKILVIKQQPLNYNFNILFYYLED